MLTEEQIRAIAAKHVAVCSEQVKCALVEDVENAIREALAAHSAGVQEPVAEVESWTNGSYHRNYKLRWLKDVEAGTKLYAQPQPMTQTGAARERPSVVLAYSTKGHNKPCGQTMGANGCGEFVTVYYGNIDAAERSARDHIYSLEKAGHCFNWAIVMRADEEAYRGPAMTFEEIERIEGAKGE